MLSGVSVKIQPQTGSYAMVDGMPLPIPQNEQVRTRKCTTILDDMIQMLLAFAIARR